MPRRAVPRSQSAALLGVGILRRLRLPAHDDQSGSAGSASPRVTIGATATAAGIRAPSPSSSRRARVGSSSAASCASAPWNRAWLTGRHATATAAANIGRRAIGDSTAPAQRRQRDTIAALAANAGRVKSSPVAASCARTAAASAHVAVGIRRRCEATIAALPSDAGAGTMRRMASATAAAAAVGAGRVRSAAATPAPAYRHLGSERRIPAVRSAPA